MRRVPSSDGVDVAVHELGGDGPALLLVHATGFHGHVLAPMAIHLRDRFRCVAPDLRGHGDTPAPVSRDFAWERFADDVLATVDGLGLDQPRAFGHSCGGAALLLAEAARPGTFAALCCYEPIVLPSDTTFRRDDGNPLSAGARRRRETFASTAEARANFASKPPFSVLHPDALDAYVEHGFEEVDGGVRLKCRRDDEADTYAMQFAHNAFRRFGDVRCPVTLLSGGATNAMTTPLVEALAAGLAGGRAETVPGLGHFGPVEDPAAVGAVAARALTGA